MCQYQPLETSTVSTNAPPSPLAAAEGFALWEASSVPKLESCGGPDSLRGEWRGE